MHKIDLDKYELRTDMAIDIINKNDYFKKYTNKDVNVTWIKFNEDNEIKKKGIYLTLEFDDITDSISKENVKEVFTEELKNFLEKNNYNKNMKACVVGIGNKSIVADSIGPLVIDKIITTKHLFDMKLDVDKKYSNVSAFSPGVTGKTGIETSDYIKAIINEIKPDILFVIDALSSTSINRVNRCIQISNAGLNPGSGIQNNRKEISSNIYNIPVIAIGIPTVINASLIVSDTINYMIKNYVFNKKNKKGLKLVQKNVNYLNKDINITNSDKKTLLGLVGMLSNDELINLVNEVLTPVGYNLMVTPKDMDFMMERFCDIISFGINNVLHNL